MSAFLLFPCPFVPPVAVIPFALAIEVSSLLVLQSLITTKPPAPLLEAPGFEAGVLPPVTFQRGRVFAQLARQDFSLMFCFESSVLTLTGP